MPETKITRAQMEKSMAVMKDWECFYSYFSRYVRGIHGTATFTKSSSTVPIKVEEGLGTSLLPVTLGEKDRIGGYPLTSQTELTFAEMKDLDSEGRSVICDFGLFVLFNLYCPNETNEERLIFKNYYDNMLDARVRNLIAAGREVIVTGDINICASDLDTAEPDRRATEKGLPRFMEHPPRKWLENWVGPNGPMIDVTRTFFPNRKGMFTCWNTKIDARPSNYGARIDYFLVTPGLMPWIKHSDIMPSIMGSDHCPVYLDLFDEIEIEGRGKVQLWDELNPGRQRADPTPEPPLMAARKMKEFGGGQQTIASFFRSTPPVASITKVEGANAGQSLTTSSGVRVSHSSTSADTMKGLKPELPKRELSSSARNAESSPVSKEVNEKTKPKTGQQDLSSFFKAPTAVKNKTKKKQTVKKGSSKDKSCDRPSEVLVLEEDSDPEPDQKPGSTDSSSRRTSATSTGDKTSIGQVSQSSFDPDLDEAEIMQAINAEAASKWQGIFTPKSAPKCTGHGEPAKLMTVNKIGINKGRRFYLCSRPVGPGYDKGGKQEQVNPEYRCDFFQWETSVKRPPGISLDGPMSKKSKA
ncbi:Class II abasic (AP) endonuclease [Microbotryomycetes sp. JL221]|nr:Class II abasic (AP) endonuclease [Microbotryomycetes sp. JL221]